MNSLQPLIDLFGVPEKEEKETQPKSKQEENGVDTQPKLEQSACLSWIHFECGTPHSMVFIEYGDGGAPVRETRPTLWQASFQERARQPYFITEYDEKICIEHPAFAVQVHSNDDAATMLHIDAGTQQMMTIMEEHWVATTAMALSAAPSSTVEWPACTSERLKQEVEAAGTPLTFLIRGDEKHDWSDADSHTQSHPCYTQHCWGESCTLLELHDSAFHYLNPEAMVPPNTLLFWKSSEKPRCVVLRSVQPHWKSGVLPIVYLNMDCFWCVGITTPVTRVTLQ